MALFRPGHRLRRGRNDAVGAVGTVRDHNTRDDGAAGRASPLFHDDPAHAARRLGPVGGPDGPLDGAPLSPRPPRPIADAALLAQRRHAPQPREGWATVPPAARIPPGQGPRRLYR